MRFGHRPRFARLHAFAAKSDATRERHVHENPRRHPHFRSRPPPRCRPGTRTSAGHAPRHRVEARRARRRDRSAGDGEALCAPAGAGALPGHQGHARSQIRAGRAPCARHLRRRAARGRRRPAPRADVRARRCLRRWQQASPGQPVLRQHHAVCGPQRPRRRQHHPPAGAAELVAGRRAGPWALPCAGSGRTSPATAAIRRRCS
jgi:hypothetical protein